ncbi:hypothetical protein [Trichothermofontia sp.]
MSLEILLAAIVIIGISAISWRRSLSVVMVLVIFEGVLRKWVLPQASDLLYFVKDLVLLGAYLRYFVFSRHEKLPSPSAKSFLITFLGLSAAWCVFQAFNPKLGSPIVGIFGLRGYFFYVPLMWMVAHWFRSSAEFFNFLRWYLLLAIPVCLLGTLQFISPPSSWLNVYAGGIDPTATFGQTGNVRITGTFPYISGYTSYLSFCFAILVPLVTTQQPKFWQNLTYIELALVVINALMTGSRGVILFQLIFLSLYLLIAVLQSPKILMQYIWRFTLPIVILISLIQFRYRSALDAFAYRWSRTSDHLVNRTLGDITGPLYYLPHVDIDGYGTGATHQAVNRLRSVLELPLGETLPPSEAEMGRILLEIGPIGFISWYGLRLSLLASLWQTALKLQPSLLRQFAVAAFLTQLIFFSGQLVVHNVFLIYYWFLSSFIYLLPKLEDGDFWSQYSQDYPNDLPYYPPPGYF